MAYVGWRSYLIVMSLEHLFYSFLKSTFFKGILLNKDFFYWSAYNTIHDSETKI